LSAAEILIVEDDEVITSTLAYNLSRHGFGVKGATTGAEALRIARKMRPDLILLDVMLPGESSWSRPRTPRKIRSGDSRPAPTTT
jgi:two-component system OmpR family response regulator